MEGSEVVLKKVRPEQPGKEERLVSAESGTPPPCWAFNLRVRCPPPEHARSIINARSF